MNAPVHTPFCALRARQRSATLRNGAELWRHRSEIHAADPCRDRRHNDQPWPLDAQRAVCRTANQRRRAEKAEVQSLRQVPSARTIARLLTISRDTLSKSETITVAAIEDQIPLLVEAREIIAVFHAMVRRKSQPDLDPWLDPARASLVASFANGVVKDKAAVEAAIDLPWSNGQTEGQITKLKLVKRQMYGRGKLDLLHTDAARLRQSPNLTRDLECAPGAGQDHGAVLTLCRAW
jgi:transposase